MHGPPGRILIVQAVYCDTNRYLAAQWALFAQFSFPQPSRALPMLQTNSLQGSPYNVRVRSHLHVSVIGRYTHQDRKVCYVSLLQLQNVGIQIWWCT